MDNLSGTATLFVSKSYPPTPQNEYEVRQVVSGCYVDCIHVVAHDFGSATTLSTVDGLRDLPSRGPQSTRDHASTGNAGSQADRDRES